MSLPEVKIYSDGGANPNPGPGGYGIIMCYKDIKKEFNGGYTRTTNNRMELTGVITGLSKLKTRSKVEIYTDSQYTINGIEKGWAKKWKENNWMRTKNEKAVNFDLWEILLNLVSKHEVKFHWVKGHNGHVENERCDELATLALESDDLIVDDGFIEDEKKKGQSQELPLQNTVGVPLVGTQKKKSPPGELLWDLCKKCESRLEKKKPKHTKKTLQKKFFYEYYHHCPNCKTNYFLEEAKRDIKELKL